MNDSSRAGLKAKTHDIFIERVPRAFNHDTNYRRVHELNANGEPLQGIGAPGRGRAVTKRDRHLNFVVRRVTEVDDQHERRELGRHYNEETNTWSPYADPVGGREFRGGRFFKAPKMPQGSVWAPVDIPRNILDAGRPFGHGGGAHDGGGAPGHQQPMGDDEGL